jgi:hypothetical protein
MDIPYYTDLLRYFYYLPYFSNFFSYADHAYLNNDGLHSCYNGKVKYALKQAYVTPMTCLLLSQNFRTLTPSTNCYGLATVSIVTGSTSLQCLNS